MRSAYRKILALLPAALLCFLLCFAASTDAFAADAAGLREAALLQRPTGGVAPANDAIGTVCREEAPLLRGGAGLLGTGEEEYCATPEEAAAVLRAGLRDCCPQITVRLRSESQEVDVAGLFALAFAHTGVPNEGDYLERNWSSRSVGISTQTYYTSAHEVDYCLHTLTVTMTYRTGAEEEAVVASMTEALLSELITEGMTDFEKVEAIYNWIASNVSYDHEGTDPQRFTAYAALTKHTAVCQGYATLFYRMALSLGIDCRYVSGSAMPSGEAHGWNIVKLGDLYYDLDVTWNSDRLPGTDLPLYFLRGSGVFDIDHIRDGKFRTEAFLAQYPTSKTDYFEPALEKDPPVRITDVFIDCSDGSAVTLADYAGEPLLLLYGYSYDFLEFLASRTDELQSYGIRVLVAANLTFADIDQLSADYPDFVFGARSGYDRAGVTLLNALNDPAAAYPMAFMINGKRECVYHAAAGVPFYDTMIPQLAALAEVEEPLPAPLYDTLRPSLDFSFPTQSGGALTREDCLGRKTVFVYGLAGSSGFFPRLAYYADWLAAEGIDVVAVLGDVADDPDLWAEFAGTYSGFLCVQSDDYYESMWNAVELYEPELMSLYFPVIFLMNERGDYVHFSHGTPGCLFDLLDWFAGVSKTYRSGQVLYGYDALAREVRLLEAVPDGTAVFAASYDADGRMLCLAALTDAAPAMAVPDAGTSVKLFFTDAGVSAPNAEAAVLAA